MRTTTSRQRWLAAAVVTGIMVGAWLFDHPAPPSPETADPTTFSAQRAEMTLREIGETPTPIGSDENAQLRDFLMSRLDELGLEAEVQDGIGSWTSGSRVEIGRVRNVLAHLPGTDSTGRVILAAHYDTVPHSPGISDDKASVAAILETIRALTAGPALRNDVVVLLTDGEEPGLLGADLFADDGPDPGDVVLNWEGYGNRGSSVLFQSADANRSLIGEFRAAAPDPVGSSAFSELFQLGSNHTDYTLLKDVGFAGLDFTPVDGIAHYHSETDTIENLDPAGLQHHGDTMLAMTRRLGDRDLSTLDSSGEVTFFTAFGVVLSYPTWLIWPLALAGLMAVAGVVVIARRRGLVTLPRILAAFGALVAPMALVPGGAYGLWLLLVAVRPGYSAFQMGDVGDVYQPGFYRVALAALSIAILAACFLLMRRHLGDFAVSVAALLWMAVVGVATATPVPGLSYLGGLSVLVAAAGILIHLRIGEAHPVWGLAAITAGVTPGVILTGLTASMSLSALGVAGGLGAAAILVLTGFLAIAGVGAVRGSANAMEASRSIFWVSLSALIVAVATTIAGLVTENLGSENPVPAHLAYLIDADTGEAVWVSEDTDPHPWVSGFVESPGDPESWPISYRDAPRWVGPAEAVDISPPEVVVLPDRAEDDTLRLQVRSPRDADVVTLGVDRRVEEATITTEEDTIQSTSPTYREGEAEWPFQLSFYDPPLEGFQVTIRLGESGEPALALSDVTYGLDEIPGYEKRPEDVITSSSRRRLASDAVVIGRVITP